MCLSYQSDRQYRSRGLMRPFRSFAFFASAATLGRTREMCKRPPREPPFFFTKCADAAVPRGGEIPFPSETNNYHYEAELVIAIGKEGAWISNAAALELVFGYAVGLDMPRRDLQLEARDKGRPWDTGKNFSFSAPIGPILPVRIGGHISAGRIHLAVNGVTKQDADIADLIWDC